MQRWLANATDSERNLVNRLVGTCVQAHNEHIALISPHEVRVSALAGRIAMTLGFGERRIMKVVESALFHDIGKNDPMAKAWLKKFRGKTVSEPNKAFFRKLHTERGVLLLSELRFDGVTCAKSEVSYVCQYHHHQVNGLEGPEKHLVAVVQVADIVDARTCGEGDHIYDTVSVSEAVRSMHNLCAIGYYNAPAVLAVASCLDVELN